ncbi:hypothetical protein EYZ11_007704 [Aspergillus tanneri]|uniref:Uncharacterized protein n=1 Tax=Aspergillus tanneri TaxID=1220188 RepID=A0A4S3JCN2_9EURO|nr:hypothetical protein EYZ11_007704 [Aspergillus tanneri]
MSSEFEPPTLIGG